MPLVKDFFLSTITSLRPTGWFSDPMFDDIDVVLRSYATEVSDTEKLEELEDNTAWFDAAEPSLFSGLLSLDRDHCAHFNQKKAGAEGGRGYYQKMVHQLVGCFAENVVVKESISGDRRDVPNIVSVDIAAMVKPGWASEGDAHQTVTITQAFAPSHAWSDLIFVEQIVLRLLGSNLRKSLTREGIDEEWALFIFPPDDVAKNALIAYEKAQKGAVGRSDPSTHEVIELPQPTETNIEDIMALHCREITEMKDDYGHVIKLNIRHTFCGIPLRFWSLIGIVIFLLMANNDLVMRLFGYE